MLDKNILNINENWDEQLKMSKITTIELILRYRFPEMRLGFLYGLTIDELDKITDQISTITKEDLAPYINTGTDQVMNKNE